MENYISSKGLQSVLARLCEGVQQVVPQASVYLYGSAATGDFSMGWSDIDFLVLTPQPMTLAQAEKLLHLRDVLREQTPDDPYLPLLEGGMLSLEAFLSGEITTCVHWSGAGEETLRPAHAFSAFSRWDLLHNGILLAGEDLRSQIPEPTWLDLRADVANCLPIVLRMGKTMGRQFAFGWLLNIARGLYTVTEGGVISKTQAAQWALENGLCPDEDKLELALEIYQNPLAYRDKATVLSAAASLGPAIMRFAQVLQGVLSEN